MKQQKNWPQPPVVQPKPVRPQTLQQQNARVVQPSTPPSARRTPPAAPPAYRPQPTPKVLQRKQAVPAQAAPARPVVQRKTPAAPPVYRPNPAPRVLQPKALAGSGRAPQDAPTRDAFATRQAHAPARQISPARPHVIQPLSRVAAPPRPHAHASRGAIQCYKLGANKQEVEEYALELWEDDELDKSIRNAPAIVKSALWIIAGRKNFPTGNIGSPSELQNALIMAGHIDNQDLKAITEVFKGQIKNLRSGSSKAKVNRLVQQNEQNVRISDVSMLGIPPSVAVKMRTESNGSGATFKQKVDEYKRKKVRNQEEKYNDEHIRPTEEGVEAFLSSVAHSGAANVTSHLIIGETAQELSSNESYKHHFNLPFSQHNHDITPSQNDGEVSVLSNTLAACVKDFKDRRGEKAITHRVALGGPYGACDGCKDRIKKFKELWRNKAKKYDCEGTLIVTYFYRNPAEEFRQGTTLYGWAEAIKPDTGEDFHYRTTGTKVG